MAALSAIPSASASAPESRALSTSFSQSSASLRVLSRWAARGEVRAGRLELLLVEEGDTEQQVGRARLVQAALFDRTLQGVRRGAPIFLLREGLSQAQVELAVTGGAGGLGERLDGAVELARSHPAIGEDLIGFAVLGDGSIGESLLHHPSAEIGKLVVEVEFGQAAQLFVLVEQTLLVRQLEGRQGLLLLAEFAVDRGELHPVDLLRIEIGELLEHGARLAVLLAFDEQTQKQLEPCLLRLIRFAHSEDGWRERLVPHVLLIVGGGQHV